ncbi:hypothetical protein AGMMS50296_0720 [Alphaproteobacteria bacterium]|nr:hypothetical protein AGMMS50296_0720 [Alphaproteobacteria bacterium]
MEAFTEKKTQILKNCGKILFLGSFLFSRNVQAVPRATGWLVEVQTGLTYSTLGEYFRASDQKKNDQAKFIEEKKRGFLVGGAVGGGREMMCRLYMGFKIYGFYDTAKVEKKEDNKDKKASFRLRLKHAPDSKERKDCVLTGHYNAEISPVVSLGGALMLGFKVFPNVLAYVSFGVEGTFTKVEQILTLQQDDKNVSLLQANGMEPGEPFQPDENAALFYFHAKHDPIKAYLLSLVPGIGLKYFLTPNTYLGVDAGVAIGLNKKVNEKYFDKTGYRAAEKAAEKGDPLRSLKELESAFYLKRKIGIRGHLSAGMKF